MNIAFWCVLVAGLMPFVVVGIAKYHRSYDNNAPRDWLSSQEGLRKRAYAAHLNCFEAFPLFAAGVIIAHLAQASPSLVAAVAGLFIIARVAYVWCYLKDKATLRSMVWTAGLCLNVALFFIAAFAAGK